MKKIEYIIYLVIIFLLLLNFYIEENKELESNDVKTYIKVEINGDSKLVTPECIKNNYFK